MSLQKGKWRILLMTDLPFQLHRLRTMQPTEGLSSCHQRMPRAAPAVLHQQKQEAPHPRQSWWGRRQHRKLHLQTKQSRTSKYCSFGLVLLSFIYDEAYPCLWCMGKSINTLHMPLKSMNSKSSTLVLVVVSYCLLKTEKELNYFPMCLAKKTKNKGKVMQLNLSFRQLVGSVTTNQT